MIRNIKIISLSFIIILGLFITIVSLLVEFTPLKIINIDGFSMTGTEKKLIKFAWVSNDLNLKRNDVIVFDPLYADISKKLSKYMDLDNIENKTYTKRILALEGEKIKIEDGKLYINNKIVKDNFSINNFPGKDIKEIGIPKNHYFVAGDYRKNSLDSRYFGPIHKKSIIAKVILYDNFIIKVISDLINIFIA